MIVRLITLAIVAAAAGPSVPPIAPGRWEVSSTVTGSSIDGRDQPVPSFSARPRTICLDPVHAAAGPGLAFADSEICRTSETTVGDGRYAYVQQCAATESSDHIVVHGEGTYRATGYEGSTISVQTRGPMTITMRAKLSARRVGDC